MVQQHSGFDALGQLVRDNIRALTTEVGDYTVTANDFIINVDCTAAARQVTITSALIAQVGRCFIIKDSVGNCAANNITIVTQGAETIDGAANLVLSTNWDVVGLYSDGSNLFVA